MPSWTIHLKIARTINKKLKLNENAFILGNVMPDILSGFIVQNPSMILNTHISHYRKADGKHNIQIKKFIQNYKDKFNNPVVLGYLTHLLADYFWNDWTYSKHYKEVNNKSFLILNNHQKSEIDITTFRNFKHQDFSTFDNYLKSTQNLGKLIKIDNSIYTLTKDIKEVPCNNKDIIKTIDILNSIIIDKPKYVPNYHIFDEAELNILLEKTYNFIFTTLKENQILY